MNQIDLNKIEKKKKPPLDGKEEKPKPKSELRKVIREALIREDEEWCSVNNPAIWAGDEDD